MTHLFIYFTTAFIAGTRFQKDYFYVSVHVSQQLKHPIYVSCWIELFCCLDLRSYWITMSSESADERRETIGEMFEEIIVTKRRGRGLVETDCDNRHTHYVVCHATCFY